MEKISDVWWSRIMQCLVSNEQHLEINSVFYRKYRIDLKGCEDWSNMTPYGWYRWVI